MNASCCFPHADPCYLVCVCSLPGSRTERALNASFYRMLPELLRHSSAARLLSYIPDDVQSVHRGLTTAAPALVAPVAAAAPSVGEEGGQEATEEPDGEIDDDLLGALGL